MILLIGFVSLLFGVQEVIPVGDHSAVSLLAPFFGITLLPVSLVSGTSRYVPKWKKQACEIPASQHPNSHYVCDEAGDVKCLPGWRGDLCDVPVCRKGCDPLQGYCRRPGECQCKFGFYGELCDKCVALPLCQHGRCNVSFECACDPGWSGPFCSEPICSSDCHPARGYCEKPGECRCRLGWQGYKCKECAVLPGCVHGTCQGPLECRCEPGWTGFLCQTPICAKGCSREHGGCRRPETCRCRVGWNGPNCTECVPYPGCVHGTCKRPWECRCQPGWTGDLCNEKLTYCDENPDSCKNNGTCISVIPEDGNFRCICPMGYMGRQCQIETTVPATELMPPMPINTPTQFEMPATSTEESVVTLSSLVEEAPVKPDVEEGSQALEEDRLDDDEPVEHKDEQTVEPLGPIFITDPPTTKEPAATAGKWPTEPPTTMLPSVDSDVDNEA
ncbi:delta-like protein C isoform X1 [Neodiprion pinetum]|uniref:delta-like protein 1 isoform X1 n=1 Tax=Neodiprion fabricii TaxID=2872261 RepID=UPI00076F9F39|nr:delta-like protein 1 isoform X1 [Neodiprion fabricii]XP_046487481.1 delta-like protein 1 isoform X1 [Neodiprion pinetum]XP_046624907.1 delta-like protein 1 isoform X1 [Neodiprion virginianus]